MRNGKLTASSNASMMVQNYCNLTLNNMVLDARDNSSVSYVMSNNCGNVQIIGNSSIYAPAGEKAFDVCWWPSSYPEGAKVEVDTTGTIDGTVEIGVYGTDEGADSLSTFTAKNGVFTGILKVDPALSESSKKNVSVDGGLFTSDTWTNSDYTENADVIAKLMDGDDVGAYHIGPASKTIDASDYDGVVVTKAVGGAVKVAGDNVQVRNGMNVPLSVNGNTVPAGDTVVVTREPVERDTTGGDYFGNAKWAEAKREIAAAEEGDTIEMSATGLPWFPVQRGPCPQGQGYHSGGAQERRDLLHQRSGDRRHREDLVRVRPDRHRAAHCGSRVKKHLSPPVGQTEGALYRAPSFYGAGEALFHGKKPIFTGFLGKKTVDGTPGDMVLL